MTNIYRSLTDIGPFTDLGCAARKACRRKAEGGNAHLRDINGNAPMPIFRTSGNKLSSFYAGIATGITLLRRRSGPCLATGI
jgi:hypothetical protein